MIFPDEYFPIDQNYIEDFNAKVENGMNYAKKLNVLFCSTCKDVENSIIKMIGAVDVTGSMFKNYSIFLYENNSSDKTVEKIKFLNNPNLILKTEFIPDASYSRSEITFAKRCQYISNARNHYVNYINQNINKYDYIIVFDSDINGGWSNDGILNSIYYLETYKDIGCMSSYCVVSFFQNKNLEEVHSDYWLMYDSFAFRPYGNWNFPENIGSHNYIKVTRGQLPFLVNSNFNGLAIYKPECFINNRYGINNYDNNTMVDCDHVVFNKGVWDKGMKVLLNPSMITSISNHKYSKELN